MALISLRDVWLKYRIQFKEDRGNSCEDFWAVKGINIEINKGEVFGVIGENGAGKTTLLNIIAGMLKPDRGTVQINGTISAIKEISAGFQRDLTGKENIYLTSSLFGLSNEQISAKYDEIIKFAGLGRFIYAPVKVYSTGMYMRLAFAIAIHMDPDILLIDETFAVGDIYAQHKCINKVFELKDQGKTIIFVSQDIEMSKRLCTRGIFIRDGEIIKEGPIDKLCTYYLETVGDKKGIAIVQEGKIGVIFNNGKLILRWKDRTITCGPAGYTSRGSLGKEYLSTTAVWQIQKSTADREIIAIGRWPDFNVRECWRIVLLNEKEFLWEIAIEIGEEICFEKFSTFAILIDSYKSWFTLKDKVDFPIKFAHLLGWQCLAVEDSINRVIGFRGNNGIEEEPPVIIFDRMQDNTSVVTQVGNTGADVGGRGIIYQYLPENPGAKYAKGKYQCFSTKVMVFEDSENNELKQYLDNVRKITQESKIIRKDSLSLFCMENKVQIYWQDRLITAGAGLNTKFKYQDKIYDASKGHWDINKENNGQIAVTISWDDYPGFMQTWKLGLGDDHVLLWEIDMDISDQVIIRNKQAELILSKEYDKWLTLDERGDFSRLDGQGNAVVLNKYINDCIGVEQDSSDDFVLPGLLFRHDGSFPTATYLSKIEKNDPSTRLRYLGIDCKGNFYIPAGKYKYFSGRIVIYDRETKSDLIEIADKKTTVLRKDEGSFNKIEFRKLSLIFDHGKGRLFFGGIEITKGLGLYSSILSKEVWYDSSQAYWEVRESQKGKLTAIGFWPWIPVSQTWEFSLPNENTVLWKISNQTWDEVILEKGQANLMLSNKYKEWFVYKKASGKFPDRFIQHNGVFWDRLWCGDTASPIGVKKCRFKKTFLNRQSLPALTFSCSVDYQKRYSLIENTDNLFQARILQCELNPNRINNAEKNKYFEAQIKITS